MARNLAIQHIRTTRANLNTQASANNLKTGEIYLITDENRLAVGLTVSTYETYAKVSEIPVKATGAELDTGTDDAKFATAKALKDSHNVPSVAPGTTGNVLTSNGTDWTSAAPSGGGATIDYVPATIAWDNVSSASNPKYSSMQQLTGITVPTPVIIKVSSTYVIQLWTNTTNSWTNAVLVNGTNGYSSSDGSYFHNQIVLLPSLYYGFKAPTMAGTITVTIISMNDLLTELKSKRKIFRDDIEGLLESIAPAGEKHQEKIDAVKQLNKANGQGIRLEDTISSYRNF